MLLLSFSLHLLAVGMAMGNEDTVFYGSSRMSVKGNGFNENGFNMNGYDVMGFNKNGKDVHGHDRSYSQIEEKIPAVGKRLLLTNNYEKIKKTTELDKNKKLTKLEQLSGQIESTVTENKNGEITGLTSVSNIEKTEVGADRVYERGSMNLPISNSAVVSSQTMINIQSHIAMYGMSQMGVRGKGYNINGINKEGYDIIGFKQRGHDLYSYIYADQYQSSDILMLPVTTTGKTLLSSPSVISQNIEIVLTEEHISTFTVLPTRINKETPDVDFNKEKVKIPSYDIADTTTIKQPVDLPSYYSTFMLSENNETIRPPWPVVSSTVNVKPSINSTQKDLASSAVASDAGNTYGLTIMGIRGMEYGRSGYNARGYDVMGFDHNNMDEKGRSIHNAVAGANKSLVPAVGKALLPEPSTTLLSSFTTQLVTVTKEHEYINSHTGAPLVSTNTTVINLSTINTTIPVSTVKFMTSNDSNSSSTTIFLSTLSAIANTEHKHQPSSDLYGQAFMGVQGSEYDLNGYKDNSYSVGKQGYHRNVPVASPLNASGMVQSPTNTLSVDDNNGDTTLSSLTGNNFNTLNNSAETKKKDTITSINNNPHIDTSYSNVTASTSTIVEDKTSIKFIDTTIDPLYGTAGMGIRDSVYDVDGYDVMGYDVFGYNRQGLNTDGKSKSISNLDTPPIKKPNTKRFCEQPSFCMDKAYKCFDGIALCQQGKCKAGYYNSFVLVNSECIAINEVAVGGQSVSLNGNGTVMVEGVAQNAFNNIEKRGQAAVYLKAAGHWKQVQSLVPTDSKLAHWFGVSVDICSDASRVVVGSWLDNSHGDHAGSVYLYQYDPFNQTYLISQKIFANDSRPYDYFGQSVRISSDCTTIVVGAYGRDEGAVEYAGSAYVFTYTSGRFIQAGVLTAPDPMKKQMLGQSLSINSDGSKIFVSGQHSGGVYVYQRRGNNNNWKYSQKIFTYLQDSSFGQSLSTNWIGDTVAVGVPKRNIVYIYRANDEGLYQIDQRGKIELPKGKESDIVQFGFSVNLNNNWGISNTASNTSLLLVGAPGQIINGTAETGAAYMYRFQPWSKGWAYLNLSFHGRTIHPRFGYAVTLDSTGTSAAITDSNGRVSVYTWGLQ